MAFSRPNLSAGLSPKLTQLLAYGCGALAGYFWLTYSGPYRWLAEWQMGVFGAYYAFYTWLGTMLLLFLPTLLAFQVPRKLGVVSSVVTTPEEVQAHNHERAARWNQRRQPFVVLVLGGTFLFLGGRDYIKAQRGRELQHLSAAALEAGKKPSSTWLEVADGALVWDASIEWTDDKSKVTYVPMLSSAWSEGGPIGVLLKLNGGELKKAQGDVHAFKGESDDLGLPGPVRAAYADAGLSVANALVLHVGQTPSEDEASGRIFALLGLAIFAVGLGLAVRQWRREQAGQG
jgi:hypothetical protein